LFEDRKPPPEDIPDGVSQAAAEVDAWRPEKMGMKATA